MALISEMYFASFDFSYFISHILSVDDGIIMAETVGQNLSNLNESLMVMVIIGEVDFSKDKTKKTMLKKQVIHLSMVSVDVVVTSSKSINVVWNGLCFGVSLFNKASKVKLSARKWK